MDIEELRYTPLYGCFHLISRKKRVYLPSESRDFPTSAIDLPEGEEASTTNSTHLHNLFKDLPRHPNNFNIKLSDHRSINLLRLLSAWWTRKTPGKSLMEHPTWAEAVWCFNGGLDSSKNNNPAKGPSSVTSLVLMMGKGNASVFSVTQRFSEKSFGKLKMTDWLFTFSSRYQKTGRIQYLWRWS